MAPPFTVPWTCFALGLTSTFYPYPWTPLCSYVEMVTKENAATASMLDDSRGNSEARSVDRASSSGRSAAFLAGASGSSGTSM